MNLLFTSPNDVLSLEAQGFFEEWRARQHIVEFMPFGRVATYLRFERASSLALVDAIVCMTDPLSIGSLEDLETIDFPFEKALALAAEVRSLPGSCAMRDGRKWRSLPFVIFGESFGYELAPSGPGQTHAHIHHSMHPSMTLRTVEKIVSEYQERVLEDYEDLGILIRFEKGRAQIGPALQLKDSRAESEYYYYPGDRRNNKGWVTVKRDDQGLRHDVELFQMLLARNASETEMHRFFEEHPAILMQARLGIPISHGPNFDSPKDNRPDFSFAPILGPWNEKSIELLELKGPAEKTFKQGFHPGFAAKVHNAVDQVRDYDRYLRDPLNISAVLRSLGYIPENAKLAVLIGRKPKDLTDRAAWTQRQSELNVEVITYDEILEKQERQIKAPYTLRFGTAAHPL
jgi:hypothetical protein